MKDFNFGDAQSAISFVTSQASHIEREVLAMPLPFISLARPT